MNAIKDVLDTHKDDRKFHLYGLPVFQEIIYKVMIQDQLVLPMILSLVMGCILFWIYRDIKLAILPFIVIGMIALWSMGFFAMEGNTLDVVTFILPVVLVIACLCDAVHIISEYRDSAGEETSRTEMVKAIVSRIGVPIFLTSITTSVGFFALATSDIRSIRNFGVFAGLGVLFAFSVSVTLLPVIMASLPVKKREKKAQGALAAIETLLSRLGEWLLGHKLHVVVAMVVIFAVCLTGAMKLRPNMIILGMFKKYVARDIIDVQHFVDVEMAGSCEFDILFKSDEAGAMLRPQTLKMIERIQERTFELYGMLQNLSIVDYLKEMNQVLHDNDPAFYRIPDDENTIEEIMLIYSMDGKDEDLEEVITFDRDQARIRLFTYTAPDSKTSRAWINQAEVIIDDESRGSDVSVEMASRPIVWVDMVESLITEMMKTFSLAFFLIFCLMFVLFRSFKLGVISAVVNIIPITVTFGFMGWFGITLNMATAMMPSIAIAVDDTIHFVWRFENEFRRHGTYRDAVIHTLKTVGKPIVITTILICVGFSVMAFSRLTILTELGLLLSLTVAAALASDLFVAPVLMLLFRPFKLDVEDEADERMPAEDRMVTD